MNCRDVQHLLHPYADGELDLVRHLEIEGHLNECAQCAEQEKNLRSLRTAISAGSLYHQAPAGLRARVHLAIHPVSRGRWWFSGRIAATAAGILLLITAAATIGMLWSPAATTADDRLAEWVVAGHVRSLQIDHLMDVVSSDRHTVKPWFQGKLDFSPQVPDLSARDYKLSGGRLDYLAERPVAALVYFRKLHPINLFTWPVGNEEEKATRGMLRQGFHIRHWQRSGMAYWAISDLNDPELDEFVRLYQEQTSG